MGTEIAQDIDAHCREIERCNQRGGRMLSIMDLLDAGTLSQDLAAHCIAAIVSRQSFLVGASPGGAGKTTVMGALLNFVPPDLRLEAATERAVLHAGGLRRCWVGHEIGPGSYFAYLWGEPLRAWFRLGRTGSMLASNIHADTIPEIEYQIIGQNSVPRQDLWTIGLILFLGIQRSIHGHARYVTELYESDGRSDPMLLWSRSGGQVAPSRTVTAERTRWAEGLLRRLAREGSRTIREVRAVFLDEWQKAPPRG